MTKRFAIFGTGFWSRFQLAAWQEVEGAECVALYNRTPAKAEELAHAFGVPRVYADPVRLLDSERLDFDGLDFIDIITNVETHSGFVRLAAERGLPVICQKPMATTLAEAEQMVAACQAARVPFFVHENWRWQTPIRQLKRVLSEGRIGRPFRARLSFCSSFPVFDNQPFLKELEQFILTDMGSHILDTARFLFGEAHSLYCQTRRVHADIAGEDVATVMMQMGEAVTVTCELSYASHTEHERFPETFILVEGERGSAELAPDCWVRVTTDDGTWARRYPPKHYPWADPAYDLVHASIVPCNADILANLQDVKPAETTGEDNLRTVRLVFAAYESARTGETLRVG
ncbi:MAG: Gfo/Idh/MocA family oxidoreductase [Chloroflexi bacterium]|jgi:predicted dehydrogenase|nr:Gfo/Idh/MocA family oxidoreductase [Chloroflexota bacterium]